ncbi:substrate-binding domain-containing protein [Terrihabitans rhizophilus]|uniref:Substrate-binding domain-containing protein n=1 Tax=Terrihabitans rhizophilus TaxID=3092662 RepID=A0ABU4RL14_9HYPH|nr:substrate-binding domain-containing protein [Terrihabitans sp. PJ23]MDX6805521.1 substrate-binding domain-containing protein [Terrihabitans sp. PJ23]
MCSAFLKGIALVVVLALPASARELRVCADPNNLPFSNERGEGFENRIAAVIAEQMGAEVSYTWWAQRRGFIRNTLREGRCDLIPGTVANMEMLRTTAPYYRSGYVFVTRGVDALDIGSFDDPRLRTLRVGVQLIGDDGSNAPPAHALERRGITGNMRGYTVYGDYAEANPAGRIVRAVAEGEVDVAVVWGPFAGYFAPRQAVELSIRPVTPGIDGPMLPMVFDISMGVRREDEPLREEVDAALKARRADVDAILASYGVPRLDRTEARR